MGSYGRQVLIGTGIPLALSADGAPEWKVGGITIDWATVTAVSEDTTLGDGVVVLTGQKYLRYGQVLCQITASGKYGPYDPDALDGRQTLTRDAVVLVNETVLQNGAVPQLGGEASDHPGGLVGGRIFKARLIANGAAGALATGPTYTALYAVMPRLVMVA